MIGIPESHPQPSFVGQLGHVDIAPVMLDHADNESGVEVVAALVSEILALAAKALAFAE